MPELSHAIFSPHIGSTFAVQNVEEDALALELIEATDLSGKDPNRSDEVRSDPFSLLFRGPSDKVLEQQVIQLEHGELGTVDLFLVPIGPDKENQGLCYEAVFN